MSRSGCSFTSSCRLKRKETALEGSGGEGAYEAASTESEVDELEVVERWNRSTERRCLRTVPLAGTGSVCGADPKLRHRKGRIRSKRERAGKETEHRDGDRSDGRRMDWSDRSLTAGKRSEENRREGNLE